VKLRRLQNSAEATSLMLVVRQLCVHFVITAVKLHVNSSSVHTVALVKDLVEMG